MGGEVKKKKKSLAFNFKLLLGVHCIFMFLCYEFCPGCMNPFALPAFQNLCMALGLVGGFSG